MALTPEQIQAYKQKYGFNQPALGTQPTTGSVGERLSTSFGNTGNRINTAINGPQDMSTGTRALEATAAGLTGALDAGKQLLPGPVRSGLDYVGEKVGGAFKGLTDFVGNTKLFKEIGDLEAQGYINKENAPEFYTLMDTLKAASAGGEIAGDILATRGIAKTAVGTAKVAAQTVAPLVRPVLGAAGRVTKRAGEGAYGLTVTPDKVTSMAQQSYQAGQGTLFNRVKNLIKGDTPDGKPITEANTAARYGLAGTEWRIGVQAKQIANDLWNTTIKPALQGVQGKVKMKEFFDDIEKSIKASTPEISRRNSLMEALQAMRDDYAKVGAASLEDLQGFKEGWASFIPDKAYQGKPIAGAFREVQNMAAGKAREIIYKHAGPDAQQAYTDYGNLKSIMEAGIKSVGDPAKKSIGRNVWEFIMDKAVTPIATVSGKVLYRTGEGLEFLGNPGARTVRDILGGTKDIPTTLKVDHQPSDYVNPTDLPVIQMGNKPKPPKNNLPTIR